MTSCCSTSSTCAKTEKEAELQTIKDAADPVVHLHLTTTATKPKARTEDQMGEKELQDEITRLKSELTWTKYELHREQMENRLLKKQNQKKEAHGSSEETKGEEEVEEILKENKDRFVLFPIKFPKIWEAYKKQEASIWHVNDVDLGHDLQDWAELKKGEQDFIKIVLAFFAASDGIVMENLIERFASEVQIPEARNFYMCQAFMEGIHSEMYSKMIDTYISDAKERDLLLKGLHTIPVITKKGEWALQWIKNPDATFAERLVAFAAVEGIFFSGSFCAIFYLKKRNLMYGLTFSNEYISRDEGLHCDFACLIYSCLSKKLSHERVLEIITSAVEIEKEFICVAIPCALIGINAPAMSQYIEFIADRLLIELGYPKHYNRENPFDWMELISIKSKTSFFERRVSEYSQAGVLEDQELDFKLDDNF